MIKGVNHKHSQHTERTKTLLSYLGKEFKMEWYLPLPIHLMDDKNGMGLVPIIDGNYQVITLFLMWQWYFTLSLGELGEFILPLIFVTL